MSLDDCKVAENGRAARDSAAKHRDVFGAIAAYCTRVAGGKWAFGLAVLTVVVWAVTGPFFDYSENWQLVINTGTTVVTFLMVFLIQNAQNRESKAIQLKLDELIRALKPANNALVDIEHLTEEQLDRLQEHYRKIAEECGPRPVDEVAARDARAGHITVK